MFMLSRINNWSTLGVSSNMQLNEQHEKVRLNTICYHAVETLCGVACALNWTIFWMWKTFYMLWESKKILVETERRWSSGAERYVTCSGSIYYFVWMTLILDLWLNCAINERLKNNFKNDLAQRGWLDKCAFTWWLIQLRYMKTEQCISILKHGNIHDGMLNTVSPRHGNRFEDGGFMVFSR